jgi:hypothetical protein
MTEELIYSFWSADNQPLTERAKEALEGIDQVFPQPTFWTVFHRRQSSPDQTFSAKTAAVIESYGGKLAPLWEKTVAHFTALNLNPNEASVSAACYSEDLTLSVHVSVHDSNLRVSVERENLRKALSQHHTRLLALLRDIGASPALGGCWFRKQSAFAGDPVCLYEQPKKLFTKLSDPLTFRQVTDEVRKVRESLRAAVSPSDWKRLLREAGADVEIISSDRLFVKLGDPKGKEGAQVLRQLEKEVKLLLAK